MMKCLACSSELENKKSKDLQERLRQKQSNFLKQKSNLSGRVIELTGPTAIQIVITVPISWNLCTLGAGADLGILYRGGGGGSGPEFFERGGFRVQVRGNFHILAPGGSASYPLKGGG